LLVNAFDGDNALIGIDAVHLKVVCALLTQVTRQQCIATVERLKLDGFAYLAPEIETLAKQFVLGSRRVTELVTQLPSAELKGNINERIN
jgi:hypothetical protein